EGRAKAHGAGIGEKAGKQSPTSIAACKTLVQATRTGTHASALVAEREAFVDLFDTADQVEGVTAFLEKRAAQWKNA
ncbi:enoyl-CoA hydratase, partial [Stenotrophomonas maltophilia]